MEKEKQNSPCCTDFECESHQKINVENKLVQACVQKPSSYSKVQTIKYSIRCKSDKKEFRKYPCYYWDVNISREKSEHRNKCRGAPKMGSSFDLLDSSLDSLLDSPPRHPYLLNSLTGFKF